MPKLRSLVRHSRLRSLRPLNAISAYEIILDAPEHAAAVEALYYGVFGPGRFAKTAERLREANTMIADASVVAVDSAAADPG